jgi:hypothetical protein
MTVDLANDLLAPLHVRHDAEPVRGPLGLIPFPVRMIGSGDSDNATPTRRLE